MPARFLACVLLLTAAPAMAQDPPAPWQLRESVDAERLFADLEALTGHRPMADEAGEFTVRTRNIHHPDHRRVGAWVEARFAAIPGLVVSRETFDAAGQDDLFNVVAELPGAEDDAPLVLGAHYDSIASASEGWTAATDDAPGADDDASGVAALFEVARVLAAWPGGLRRTVRFVAFTAEEYGLLGSVEHVARLEDRGEDVALMLSLDPIGYDPGGSSLLWVPYDERWPEPAERLAGVASELGARVDVSTIDADLIGGDERSDHAPFWAAGFPALHLASFPQPPSYHTVEDDLDVVDPAFHFEVTALVTAFAAGEAELLAVPEEAACEGCRSDVGGGFGSLALLGALAAGRRRRGECAT